MPRKIVSQDDLVDLHGKVVLVTGGNMGIGYATIQMLARRGAKVLYRFSKAILKLEAENLGDGSVQFIQLDLSDPRAVSRVAKEFLEKENRLDILINNAANLPWALRAYGPYKLNADGLMDGMVVNYISAFVLTETLLPLLKRTAAEPASDVRIVNLNSMSHAAARVTTDTFATKESLNKDFGAGSGMIDTYGYSKLASLLYTKGLQTRLDSEGVRITCLAPHPGLIRTVGSTNAVASIPYLGWLLTRIMIPLAFTSWDKGAMAVGFAAAGKDVVGPNHAEYKGAYLTPMDKITAPSPKALDVRLQNELYETTTRVVQELGL
ncbi:NAD(P)-binding protein [Mycena crocata]|nr:NAD(P)-binding protein [Mycena crocata]